jgi:tetratricopeptide (TPR) repeat protein
MKKRTVVSLVLMVAVIIAGCPAPEVKQEKPTATKEKNSRVEEHLVRAQEQETRGELVEALESYRLALKVDPANATALSKRTELEAKLNALAAENYRAGVELQRVGKYAQAKQKFQTALRYKPNYPEASEMLKAERIDSQKVRTSFPHVVKPGELLSQMAERYYRDSQKHYLIGVYNDLADAAKIAAGQTLKVPVLEGMMCFVTPEEANALSNLQPGPMPPEVIVVQEVATHTTRAGDTLAMLAQQYYRTKERADLIAKYNNIKETSGFKAGRNLLIPQVLGSTFIGAGSAQTSNAEASEAVPSEEKTAASEAKGEPPKEPPKQTPPVVAAAPADPMDGVRNQGVEFYKAKNYPAAIAEFKKVLNVQPRDPTALQYISQAHFDLGVKSFEQKSYLQAVENFKASQGYNQNCTNCEEYIRKSEDAYKEQHYNQGMTHFKNEKLAEAIQEWERVQAIDPAYKDVSKNLQKARLLQERLEAIKSSKPQ